MTVAMKSELFLVMCLFFISGKCQSKNDQKKIIDLVKMWSSEIGRQLTELSRTMTRLEHAEKSFRPLETKLMKETPEILVHDIASHISELMDTKAEAVKNIAEYAEFLSYHRSNESLFENGTYYFFNSDNITKSARDQIREEEIANDILSAECHWACAQANVSFLSNNKFSYTHNRDALFKRRRHERGKECSCSRLTDMDRPPRSYLNLPLEYDPKFDDYVNLNLSIAKLALNVYQREQSVLEGLKWSEALDLVFKDNLAKDPSLTWQYFASPRGFLRHFPAIKWSQERYDRTYDFRTRTWYTEAITSPKDIIILLDRSGSMKGTRKALSQQIVNQILDTLNDNDFVNIYTFTNTTEPLVDCFNDTLFQANEENLRLLRENLPVYEEEDVADLSVGFKKAFYILENFRHTQTSARCNQAIILITEGIDYEYDKKMFEIHNWKKDFPIRIFSFQVGIDINDAIELEWIACANMGYWGNMTHMGDIREKMLSYLNVMSRPINYNGNTKNKENRKYIWSYLHVDLTDRRLSNWLWKKFEGIRQREVFLDHVKRDFFKKKKFFSSTKHMLLEESHEYEKYNKKIKYKYMTTVSLPVYGRREGEVELIGVAGIDVPIHLFKAQIPFDRLGVNGYAFIVTNNGYILIHPDHRTEFENILKPTFNRVDILEVEVLDDNRKPRLFGESVVKLREKLVNQNESISITLNVKYPLNDMRRVMLAKRHYYYSKIGPFTLGIVLPDKYGYVKINKTRIQKPPLEQIYRSLVGSNNWTVHPEWIYCQKCEDDTPEGKVRNAFSTKENSPLLNALFDDLVATTWFDTENANHYRYVLEYQVHKIFLATHSGLTRWKTFSDPETEQDPFEKRETRAIDSDWYRRTVELNYAEENVFIYSVPFETSGYENNTMITSTKAIFVGEEKMKTPVAVVGLQFNHREIYEIYNDITTKCGQAEDKPCRITCKIKRLNCYILDNNAYIVLSDEPEYIGRYIGDIRADIMADMIEDGVYIPTKMFDYQAICQKIPPEPIPEEERNKLRKERWAKERARAKAAADAAASNSASAYNKVIDHVISISTWLWQVMIFFIQMVYSQRAYQTINPEMIAFNKLAIVKTVPTPCDHSMWLFNVNKSKVFPISPYKERTNKFLCDWPYVVDKIPNTNLLFLATNDFGPCKDRSTAIYSTEPKEIIYNTSLPCYIATMNNYTRRMYMDCYNRNKQEDILNQRSRAYCGHSWK